MYKIILFVLVHGLNTLSRQPYSTRIFGLFHDYMDDRGRNLIGSGSDLVRWVAPPASS